MRTAVAKLVSFVARRFLSVLVVVAVSLMVIQQVQANAVKSIDELEYNTVLYSYYQQHYFNALVEHEYSAESGNSIANSAKAQVVKGGMLLSYGMAEHSREIFQQLLAANTSEQVANRAWFYVAQLYYQKNQYQAASDALQNVEGRVPLDIHSRYHYLATLLNIRGKHLLAAENIVGGALNDSVYEPYLLYNLAVNMYHRGENDSAAEILQRVTDYADGSEELAVLSDRARHGLAELAVAAGHFPSAWFYLQDIRTTGLYSNRALLSYGWAAIRLQRYEQAIPALKLLDQRSIAIPEVQETKVLLPHLYEQQGYSRRALKGYLLAEKAFKEGVSLLDEARAVIAMQDVPEEFISNLDLVVDDSDWYGVQPDINYQKLTPFLIDLMASHVFQATLKELGDLYAMRNNLDYWKLQARQHELILADRSTERSIDAVRQATKRAAELKNQLDDRKLELKLNTLTLAIEDQRRFRALLETSSEQLEFLDDKIQRVQAIEQPQRHSQQQVDHLHELHASIDTQLLRTNHFIDRLEPVLRNVINAELDKHEERMRYYWAQARLAKARLYDQELDALQRVNKQPAAGTGVNK